MWIQKTIKLMFDTPDSAEWLNLLMYVYRTSYYSDFPDAPIYGEIIIIYMNRHANPPAANHAIYRLEPTNFIILSSRKLLLSGTLSPLSQFF
jgi:hypothetical protein